MSQSAAQAPDVTAVEQPAAAASQPFLLTQQGKSRPLRTWLLLIAVLLVCLPPMLIGLGERDSTHTMEDISLLSSQETWLRQRGHIQIEKDPNAWLMPSRNGEPRVTKPPLLVWTHMLAWWDLEPATSTVSQLAHRARLVAVVMGLILIVSAFWAGGTLGDPKLAVMAGLVAGVNIFVQRQARTASYDIHMAAWASLSVASALWAMAPFRPRPALVREIAGWGIGGLALAAAWMSKGPLALVVVVLPLVALQAADRKRWKRNLVGFLALVALAAVLVWPWYHFALTEFERATKVWSREFGAQRPEFQVPWYYLGLIALVAPWSIWLISGVLLPFLSPEKMRRRLLLLPWLWFMVIFVFFSIPGAKQQRYILPIMPAAAILIAQLWHYHQRLADKGEHDPGVNLLRVPHWAVICVGSVLVGPFVLLQGWMLAQGWVSREPVGPVPLWMLLTAWPVLLVLAGLGTWWHFKWKPARAFGATVAWMLVLSTVLWQGYSYADWADDPIRPEGERIAALVGDRPFYYLRLPETDDMVNEEFLMYARRIVPEVLGEELAAWTQTLDKPTFIMARIAPEHDALLRDAGWRIVPDSEFLQDLELQDRLWIYEP